MITSPLETIVREALFLVKSLSSTGRKSKRQFGILVNIQAESWETLY